MKIELFSHFALFLFILLLIQNGFPAVQIEEKALIDSTFDKELILGFDYVSKDQYIEALAIFDSLQQLYPHHPAPYFYKAATYQTWMLTYRFNEFQEVLNQNAKLTIDKGNKLLEDDNDPWLNFYVGAAYGYKALHSFRQHNWIGAYLEGRRGISNFKTALKKSPNLYDCYYGLGSYHYWSKAKSRFIAILTFWMKDTRKLGLEQLELSIDKGRYCPYEAMHGLIIAYYHHGDYDKALELIDVAVKIYEPPSLGALYMRGRLMIMYKDWISVRNIFQNILDRIVAQPYQSISYQVECKYWIAVALKNQNQLVESFDLVKHALDQSESWVKGRELENPFEDVDFIKKQLKKLI